MTIKEVSPGEAHSLHEQGYVLVDVRSAREYRSGHPAGAVNVPLIDFDENTGQFLPNEDFVRVMQANFPVDTRLLVSCQVGGRSMRAAQMLVTFGFEQVINVRGGFEGARDRMSGRVIEVGWSEAGLPVETDSPPGGAYHELLAVADAST